MRTVHVALGERSYHIWIGKGVWSQLGEECRRLGFAQRCAIITDSNVGPRYAAHLRCGMADAGFDPVTIVIPAGERAKQLKTVAQCCEELAGHRLERRSFVLALGGGVVGDLAGYVAATYMRGIPFVQVPTTLLAQVDSSVGGKVGVNLKAGKNLVGAFHQPRLVLCDLETLATLPARELTAGLAEVIKYGIIADPQFFALLESGLESILQRHPDALAAAIARCCEIKASVVGQDETESGLRAILNFGHTVGHALEKISKYGRFLHGEAIAIGQVAAAHMSAQVVGLPAASVDRIIRLLDRAGLPTTLKLTLAQQDQLLAAMRVDKKVSGGEIKFVLAKEIGNVLWGQRVPDEVIRHALQKLAPPTRKLSRKQRTDPFPQPAASQQSVDNVPPNV